RRAADRALIDVDDAIDLVQSFDAVAWRGIGRCIVQRARYVPIERVVDERRLAGARYAGDTRHDAEGYIDRHTAEVVAPRVHDAQRPILLHGRAQRGHGNLARPREILARDRARILRDLGRRALRDHFAAVHARARAQVDDVIRVTDRIFIVFDDDDRIAEIAQPCQGVEIGRASCRGRGVGAGEGVW